MKKTNDPLGFLEVNRGDSQLGLEQRMPLLHVRLILVDPQDLLAGCVLEVGPVDRVVGPVAAIDLMGERDRPVGRDVQLEDELLKVRPMVLVEAMRDPGLVEAGFVAAMDGDGGRIVMNPPGVELEPADNMDGQAEEKTAAADRGQVVQHSAHPIVVEGALLFLAQAQGGRVDGFGPLGDAVHRGQG